MKKQLAIDSAAKVAAAVVLLALTALVSPAKAADFVPSAEMVEAMAAIKDTSYVVEVIQPASASLWISVRPLRCAVGIATCMDGFAEYACGEMFAAKARVFVVVHVWDASAMARGEMVEVGKHVCDLKK